MHASQSPHGQGRVERGWQSFAGYVTQVKAEGSIHQLEIVQEIAAHGSDGLEFVGNRHRSGVKRFWGEHFRLDGTSLFEFLGPQFFNGMQVERWHECIHLSARRRAKHRERELGVR
jgi:hypothetical protein